MYYKPSLLII